MTVWFPPGCLLPPRSVMVAATAISSQPPAPDCSYRIINNLDSLAVISYSLLQHHHQGKKLWRVSCRGTIRALAAVS